MQGYRCKQMPDSYTRSRDIERDIEWDIEQDSDDNATSARLTNDLIDSTDLVTCVGACLLQNLKKSHKHLALYSISICAYIV